MRILLVNKFHYMRGGSETYHFAVAEGLRERGHEVAFFSMDDPRNFPCEQSKYFVRNVDYSGHRSVWANAKDAVSLVYSAEARDKFNTLVEDFCPDVIHLNLVHRQITFSILDAPAAQGIPVVYTAHDYIPVCPNCTFLNAQGEICEECLSGSFRPCAKNRCVKGSIAKSALAVVEAEFLRAHGSYGKIDCFIAPSRFMKQKLVEGGIPSNKIKVMRNFSVNSAGQLTAGRCKKDKYLLYIGRLSPEKDLDTLIVGFASAVDLLPHGWKLVIAGDGPERGRLQDAVRHSSIADAVRFLGHVGSEEVSVLLEDATAVVLSSKCYENAPYSISESLSHGIPVIGSHIGGIAECIDSGNVGYTFPMGDAQALSDCMKRLEGLSDEEYEKMSKRCIEYVHDNLDKAKYFDELTDLYRHLCERKVVC